MTEQTINGSNGNDILIGTTDNDVINAWRGSDSIFSGLGDDNIFLNDDGSTDTIDGGAGRDSLYFQLSPNNVTFKDNIFGIEALLVRTSSLTGQGGTVTISDKILSGSNQLTVYTENFKEYGVLIDASSFSSANSVYFAPDTVVGRANDTYIGGAGNDVVRYWLGNQSLEGFILSGDVANGWKLSTSSGDKLKISFTNGRYLTTSSLFGNDSLTSINTIELAGQGDDNDYQFARISLDSSGKAVLIASMFPAYSSSNNNVPTGYPSAVLTQAQVNKAYMVYASDLLKGFSDADGDTLTVVNLSTNTGSLTNNNNGSWTFNPQKNYTGLATFSYTVTDNKGGNIVATQSLTVNAVSLPIVSVSAGAIVEGNLGEQNIEVNVSLNKASATDVTVNYTVETGIGYRDETTDWATPNVDFTGPSSGTMTILAGQTHGYILFSILGDTTAEKNEILGIINLANPKNADLATVHAASMTIINDDVAPQNHAPLGKASAILSSTAKDTPYSIISSVLLQGFSDADGDSLSVKNLSATHGNITNNNNGTWTFIPENNYSGIVNLSYTVEDNRNGSINTTQSFIIQANPKLSVNSSSTTEGDSGQTNLTFTLTLSQALQQIGSIDYTLQSGTATSGTDFTTASGTVQFNAGETSKTITVPVLGDTTIENDETLNLVLSNPSNLEFSNGSTSMTATGMIRNDDFPILTIANTPTIQEGNSGQSNLNFTVQLSDAPVSAVSVDYTNKGLTATAGQDFTAQTGILKFAAGEKEKTISVSVLGDTTQETDETLSLVLSNPQNTKFANNAAQLSSTGTIVDDDGQSIRLSSPSIKEGDSGTSNLKFIVSLERPVLTNVSFDYKTEEGTATATADIDYLGISSTMSIPAGSQSVEIPISILGDLRIEANETVKLTVSNVQGVVLQNGNLSISSIGTIIDDDFPTVSIPTIKTVYQPKIGFARQTVLVTLNAPTLVDGVISYHTESGSAIQGSDYIETSGRLTIPANSDSGVITIPIVAADSSDAPNETFKLVIDKVEGGVRLPANQLSLSSVITIADLTIPLLSIQNSEITEGNTGNKNLSFQVNLSAPAKQDVTFIARTIDKTATLDQDYKGLLAQPITIIAGNQSIDIPVAILGDTKPEADETFTLELSKINNAVFDNGDVTLTASGKIRDDDKPVVRIEDVSVIEGNSGLHDVEVKVTLNSAAITPVVVHYVSLDGTANAGDDFIRAEGDLTIPVGAKEASIPVSIQGDTKPESAQDFHIVLSNPVNGQFLNSTLSIQNTVTIKTDDGDNLPLLTVTQKPVYEGDMGIITDYPVTLKLSTPATNTFTVDYQTLAGDAKTGSDFITANGTLTFLAGESVSQVTIKVYGDSEVESDESFTLQLSNPQGIRLASDLPTQDIPLLIQDDDAEPAQTLEGTTKSDLLDLTKEGAGTGDDTIKGYAGADTMIGGDGNDTYYVDNIKDVIIEGEQSQSNAGDDDLVHSTATAYTMPANVEHLIIDGKTKGKGNGTGNVLDNRLIGNLAVNILSGLAGNDTLDGGSGNDTLTGGDGADTFIFSSGIKGNKNIDTVKDFVHGQDKIYLSADIFSKLAAAVGFASGNESLSLAKADSRYLVSAAKVKAVDVNSYLLYDTATGRLSYDEDGSGKLVASSFVTVTGKPTLTLDDFWIE